MIADVDDIGVLNFIVAARTAMPQLIDTLRLYERALDDVRAIIALRRELDDRESGTLLGELERVLGILDVPSTVGTRAAPARPRRAASHPRPTAARPDARTAS